jgi:hypothetical protein
MRMTASRIRRRWARWTIVFLIVVNSALWALVATRLRGILAFGPPASGSAGCGLDRSPDPARSLRSRGAPLLPAGRLRAPRA